MAQQIKASNVKAPRGRGMATQRQNACMAIGVGVHQWLSGTMPAVHNTTSGASTVAWFLIRVEIFLGFQNVKTKA